MTRNSRDKLNAYHLSGSIGIAALLAFLGNSLPLFFLIAGVLVVTSLFTGEVRFPHKPKGKRSQ